MKRNATEHNTEILLEYLIKKNINGQIRYFQTPNQILLCLTDLARAVGCKKSTAVVQRYCIHKVYIPARDLGIPLRCKGLWFGTPQEALKLLINLDAITLKGGVE